MDSTALALLLAEREPRDYVYLITPTGNELPEMEAHWAHLEGLLGKPLTRVTNGTLDSWIGEFDALPNHRQRWCTRLLKIEPTIVVLHRWYRVCRACKVRVVLHDHKPKRSRARGR